MTVESVSAASRLWARHAAIPLPSDLSDDQDLKLVHGKAAGVAESLASSGRIDPAEATELRSLRPGLHAQLLTMRPSAERGYVESLLTVVDALLATARLG